MGGSQNYIKSENNQMRKNCTAGQQCHFNMKQSKIIKIYIHKNKKIYRRKQICTI